MVRPPPRDYDFRAETSAATRDTVQRLHPELMDLVDDGTLVIVKRPPHYVERRSDGYVEPEVVYIVGTAHMSRLSADQVNFLFFSLALSLQVDWKFLDAFGERKFGFNCDAIFSASQTEANGMDGELF